jgi:hypothetical protein
MQNYMTAIRIVAGTNDSNDTQVPNIVTGPQLLPTGVWKAIVQDVRVLKSERGVSWELLVTNAPPNTSDTVYYILSTTNSGKQWADLLWALAGIPIQRVQNFTFSTEASWIGTPCLIETQQRHDMFEGVIRDRVQVVAVYPYTD